MNASIVMNTLIEVSILINARIVAHFKDKKTIIVAQSTDEC